jgi:transposase
VPSKKKKTKKKKYRKKRKKKRKKKMKKKRKRERRRRRNNNNSNNNSFLERGSTDFLTNIYRFFDVRILNFAVVMYQLFKKWVTFGDTGHNQ